MKRKNLYRLTLIVAILFVFFAPVVPMTVSRFWLLPWWNQCYGLSGPGNTTVYSSISAAGFGLLFPSGSRVDFGLVYVPNNGWYSFQFPPVGFGTKMCLSSVG